MLFSKNSFQKNFLYVLSFVDAYNLNILYFMQVYFYSCSCGENKTLRIKIL